MEHPKVYWQRYYVLGVFCMQCMVAMTTFNSFAPIADSLEYAFDFTDQDIALINLLGFVSYVFFLIPCSGFIERYGMRVYMLGQSVLTAVLMVLRCIPVHGRAYTALCTVQTTLVAIITVGQMAMAPFISIKWFPMSEWRVATGLGIFVPVIGASFAYKLGPWIVPSPHEGSATMEDIQNRIHYYFYGLTVACALSALWIIAYFPDHPPTPPTKVAEFETEHPVGLWDSVKIMFKSSRFWLCCLRCLAIGAPVVALSSLLLPYLRPKGIDQDYAGNIGLAASLLGIPIAVVLGKVADVTKRHIKALVVAPTLISCEGAIWLFLMGHGYLPLADRSVFMATCLYMAPGGATLGLMIELACENLYPIPEEYIAALMVSFSTLTTVVINLIFLIPSIDVAVIDYVVLICTLIGTVGSFFLPSHYKRSKAETKAEAGIADCTVSDGGSSSTTDLERF